MQSKIMMIIIITTITGGEREVSIKLLLDLFLDDSNGSHV
jgi:hypothetical protein